MELFFDLVYVFAVTQLSHYLLDHRTVHGALQATLLLAIVWLAWAYTAWVTNWLLGLLGRPGAARAKPRALRRRRGPRGRGPGLPGIPREVTEGA